MSGVVVVGAQWGDEGKGKIVDILAELADMVVRFQGGANAGHTLVVDNRELITHLVPSGVMHKNKKCVIGNGVVVDPQILVKEIDELKAQGLLSRPDSLVISSRCQVVMPYHKKLDAAREKAKGSDKIGTTLRGIGPTMEDKAARVGIRVCDLFDTKHLAELLDARLGELNAIMQHYGQQPIDATNVIDDIRPLAQKLKPFVGDTGATVRTALDQRRGVLFEGAQGALLDIDHGTYPFVTSSNTLAGAACAGAGVGPGRIDSVIGVSKAYCTRVGAGPFPSEMADDRGERLREAGGEFGATTGRPRRCGWLDLVALRYTTSLHGCTGLCLTKMDVLTGMDKLKVVVGYQLDGQEINTVPADIRELQRVQPIFDELDGWDEAIDGIREYDSLPAAAKKYLMMVESFLGIPVDLVSVGPARVQTILRKNPFHRAK